MSEALAPGVRGLRVDVRLALHLLDHGLEARGLRRPDDLELIVCVVEHVGARAAAALQIERELIQSQQRRGRPARHLRAFRLHARERFVLEPEHHRHQIETERAFVLAPEQLERDGAVALPAQVTEVLGILRNEMRDAERGHDGVADAPALLLAVCIRRLGDHGPQHQQLDVALHAFAHTIADTREQATLVRYGFGLDRARNRGERILPQARVDILEPDLLIGNRHGHPRTLHVERHVVPKNCADDRRHDGDQPRDRNAA
jgi:hypothetical protein